MVALRGHEAADVVEEEPLADDAQDVAKFDLQLDISEVDDEYRVTLEYDKASAFLRTVRIEYNRRAARARGAPSAIQVMNAVADDLAAAGVFVDASYSFREDPQSEGGGGGSSAAAAAGASAALPQRAAGAVGAGARGSARARSGKSASVAASPPAGAAARGGSGGGAARAAVSPAHASIALLGEA